MRDRGALTTGHRVVAAAVILVSLGFGVVSAQSLAGRSDARAERDAIEDLAALGLPMQRLLDDIVEDARTIVDGALPRPASHPSVQEVGEELPLAVIARDEGRAVLVVDGDGDGEGGLPPVVLGVLVPLYRDGATTSLDAPATSAQRRERLAGVVLVDRSDQATALLESIGGRDVQLRSGDSASREGLHALRVATTPSGTDVLLAVEDIGSGRVAPLAVVGVAAAAGVLLAVSVLVLGRRSRNVAAEVEAQASDLRAIAEIVPVVQRSLEIADVLPAVATAMQDAFALRGVSVSLRDAAGRDVTLFSVGTGQGATERVFPLERARRRIGTLRLVEGQPLHPRQLEALHVVTDAIASALANAALYTGQQQLVDRLREVDELKNVFLAIASHELRTPVTSINGFASVLSSSWDTFGDDERRDFVRRIAVNANSLEELVGQLLDFARMEGGRLEEGEPLDLAIVVAELRPQLESQLPDHELVVRLDDEVWSRCTRGAIDRIVSNLVGNAAKYSPAGSTIDLAVRSGDSEVTITVDDEGSGVAPEDRERVFERFYRGGGAAVLRSRGAGVGLSIVRDFVVALDGTVEVTDAPAGGARFVVRLPRVPPPEPAEPSAEGSIHVH